MANIFRLKRTDVPGRIPLTSDLQNGELAVNLVDGRLFFKKIQNEIESIITLEAPKPLTVALYQEGELLITEGEVRWHNPQPVNISKIIARLATQADGNVTLVIKKSDITVQTIIIPEFTSKVTETVDIDMIEDDFLTVDITTIGGTFKGEGLSVQFTYSFE